MIIEMLDASKIDHWEALAVMNMITMTDYGKWDSVGTDKTSHCRTNELYST